MSKIHLISFSIPLPADYGGVIDVFYKIKALKEQGIEVILHAFQYDRKRSKELSKYCSKVHYYPRDTGVIKQFSSLPYIVVSRGHKDLIENLLKDDYPILFEGLHSCFYITDKRLKKRMKIVRSHNIEHDYYSNLAEVESNLVKKKYFQLESKKLKKFEKMAFKKADVVLAISKKDHQYISKNYDNSHWVSAFHSFEKIDVKKGKSNYCLYHGKLDVSENNEAAMYLVNKVFSKTKVKLVVAGSSPSKELIAAVEKHDNVELKADISETELVDLIRKAHINVLPTFQSTGIKLKLLSALFVGRFCIANKFMVKNTGLEEMVRQANTIKEWVEQIESLMQKKFENGEIELRQKLETSDYSNKVNAEKIVGLLEA